MNKKENEKNEVIFENNKVIIKINLDMGRIKYGCIEKKNNNKIKLPTTSTFGETIATFTIIENRLFDMFVYDDNKMKDLEKRLTKLGVPKDLIKIFKSKKNI